MIDVIGSARSAINKSAVLALGMISESQSTRMMANKAIQRGFMNHMARPMMYGAAGGAATFMAGSLVGGAINGNMPTPGQVLGAGLRGGILGGLGGGLFGGMRRMAGPGFSEGYDLLQHAQGFKGFDRFNSFVNKLPAAPAAKANAAFYSRMKSMRPFYPGGKHSWFGR